MSHIGNANKMVSDTPISDSTPHNVAELGMLCRKLKRELNTANAEIEEKRKDVVWLATEKAKLEERIKRLEEALERLFNLPNDCCCQLSNSSLDAWNNAHEALKAMEAKP